MFGFRIWAVKNSQNLRCACFETQNSAGVIPRAMRAGIELPTWVAGDDQGFFHAESIHGFIEEYKGHYVGLYF